MAEKFNADGTGMRHLFVYGTLRDRDVLKLALNGSGPPPATVEAWLPDHAALISADGPFPVLRPAPGQAAPGLVLCDVTEDMRAALDWFEGAFRYRLEARRVETADGPRQAEVFIPDADLADTGRPWRLEDWAAERKPLFLSMAREIVDQGIPPEARATAMPGIRRRAIARLRAAAPGPERRLGTAPAADAVTILGHDRRFSGFFALDEFHLRHRRFDGGESPALRREILLSGDGVLVLPWDPHRDEILLIEQLRMGRVARGDAYPWNLEVIAGLIDKDEPAAEAARREAAEEAGIDLGRLHRLPGYYTSPALLTEHITPFIAEADLSGYKPGVHGLAEEHEDIRTMVVPVAAALEAIDRGEVENAHLLVMLLALGRLAPALRADWT